jgi:hypothetical protein
MSRADSPLAGRMLFLVGARRSGTNWVQHLLTLHPAVAGLPSETHLFSHGVAMLRDRVQHGLTSSTKTGSIYMNRDDFLDATRDWCDAVFGPTLSSTGARILVERTPMHAHHLDLIAAVYPDARVLHLVRDGTAVARSLLAQEWGPTSLRDAAREWADVVRAVHASDVPHLREVRNEDIVADPVTAVASLWEWLGLDVTDDLRAAVRQEAAKPVNVTAGRPGTSGPGPLSAAEAATVVEEAGAQLSVLGYPPPQGPRTGAHEGPPEPHRRAPALRQLLDRGRAAVRRARPAPGQPTAAVGGMLWSEAAQAAVDRLTAALETRDRDALGRVLTPDAQVTVDSATAVRGDAAVAALLQAATPATGARQVFSAVHPANPAFTVAVSHVRPGHPPSWRVLVVTPRGEQVASVACYLAEGSSTE